MLLKVSYVILLWIATGVVTADEEWTARLRSKRLKSLYGSSFEESVENAFRRQKRQTQPVDIVSTFGPANGKKLRAVTIEAEPFTMIDHENKKYYGMIPELFDLMGHRENLHFTMYHVPDGRYGYKDKDSGEWTGMIGEVQKREELLKSGSTEEKYADIVAAPLTMSSSREEIIDYINPFKHTGLVMVLKKIPKEDFRPVNFRVTDPLSTEVWIICTAAVLVVGLVMFAINHVDPYEWSGRHSIGRASEIHAESFNLSGSLWFAFTTLQWQGYERAPRSVAGRVLSIFWFTFVTITLITYTASLVNWLFWASTVHGKDYVTQPIADLEHLVMSNQYTYGCVGGGSTYNYLTQIGRGEVFDKIREHLNSEEGVVVDSTAAGFAKARADPNYVFISEELTGLHETNKRPCDLAMTGKVFAPRAYSMAHRNDLEPGVVDQIHASVLEMHEDGTLEALEKKWFVDKGECWNVTRTERMMAQQAGLAIRDSPKQITLTEYWGPLVLIVVGIVASILTSIAETAFYKYKGRYQPENRPGAAKLQLDEDGGNI